LENNFFGFSDQIKNSVNSTSINNTNGCPSNKNEDKVLENSSSSSPSPIDETQSNKSSSSSSSSSSSIVTNGTSSLTRKKLWTWVRMRKHKK
jgi:hypothetical protein